MDLDSVDRNRRRLLQTLLALGVLPASQLSMALPKLIHRRAIPGNGEKIPMIGMGSSRTFNERPGSSTQAQLTEVLQTFFRMGGTLIDSSPMYGNAEAMIGALLKQTSRQAPLFAATKVWTEGMEDGIAQMENSRKLWGIERFDLMQIHNLVDWKTHLRTLKTWKDQGRIRYIGITTSHGRDHAELEQILRTETFDFVQFSYSIGNRDVEDRLLPIASDRGIATLINRPFMRGSLFRRVRGQQLPDWAREIDCESWAQLFLKFVISHPDVTCVIPATSKVKHIKDNMGAGFGALPDRAMRKRMQREFDAL